MVLDWLYRATPVVDLGFVGGFKFSIGQEFSEALCTRG